MSTRCNIVIRQRHYKPTEQEDSAILYKHHDGYPSGVGACLLQTISNQFFTEKSVTIDRLKKTVIEEMGAEDDGFIHSDIDYLYNVDILPDAIFFECVKIGLGFNGSKTNDIIYTATLNKRYETN